MKYSILFFDLDGTLINSAPQITHCIARTVHEMAEPALSDDQLLSFVGPPLIEHFQNTFPHWSLEKAQIAKSLYRNFYLEDHFLESEAYSGIDQLLNLLNSTQSNKITSYVVTNKHHPIAKEIVEQKGWNSHFREVYGLTEQPPVLNKTALIEALLQRENITPTENILMIGDRFGDILAAAANGIKGIGVTYGFGSLEELKKAGAHRIANSVEELEALLRNEIHLP